MFPYLDSRPDLATARLSLRRPAERDGAAIISIVGDWDVARRLARVPHPYGPDDARFFLDRGVGTAVLTMGGEGCLIVARDGTRLRLPAHDVAVSDTTGCGDSFTSGFIVGLHHGWDLERCGRFATAVSAIVATGLGSNARLVSFEATLATMSSMPLKPLS